MIRADMIIRNVRPLGGALVDIAISNRFITGTGQRIAAKAFEIDGKGQAIIPGLADHHIHLLATASRRSSLDLAVAKTRDQLVQLLRSRTSQLEPGQWIRAVNYDDRLAGILGSAELDIWCPHHPLRIQDRTGALWMLNSHGVAALGPPPFPPSVECDESGKPVGRVWRGDDWMRGRLGVQPPSLAALGKELARLGITSLTDAGADNGPAEAVLLAKAVKDGAIPQRLMVMGREDILPSPHYQVGPVKFHLDEHELPPLEDIVARISTARRLNRPVAAHCVTLGELVFYLAALDAAGGAKIGDRIEHGGIITKSLLADIARAQVTVVTQPGFVHDRGDRFLAEGDPLDQDDYYRLGSLIEAGIAVAGSSDAPYSSFDPWLAIRSARDRLTVRRQPLGASEAIITARALELYWGNALHPGGPARRIAPGEPADMLILDGSYDDLLADPQAGAIMHRIIAGQLVSG